MGVQMDVQKYLNEDLKFIENLMSELNENIWEWSSKQVSDKTDVMFATFHSRFTVEDFLIRHLKVTGTTEISLKDFLSKRSQVRNDLDNVLMMSVDDPIKYATVSKLILG